LRMHQAAGHRVILESASPCLYVPTIARHLGINEIICTRIRIEAGICYGEIIGPNCKGEAKVTLLRDYLGTDSAPANAYSYGDSLSDLPLLRWVPNGFLLRRGSFHPVAVHSRTKL
jgi:phosphatidylglycerophosphatase C